MEVKPFPELRPLELPEAQDHGLLAGIDGVEAERRPGADACQEGQEDEGGREGPAHAAPHLLVGAQGVAICHLSCSGYSDRSTPPGTVHPQPSFPSSSASPPGSGRAG